MLPLHTFQGLNWYSIGARTLGLVVTWLLVWYLVRNAGQWGERLYARVRPGELDPLEFRSLDTVGDALMVTAGVTISLAILQLTPLLMSMLTAAGVTGVIIGFAVKDVASNLISGIMLLLDRPFKLGDFVTAGNVQGTVVQVSLRSSSVRTLDGPVISVPNSIIAANSITNFTVNPLRRFEIVLNLPLSANLDKATDLLLEVAASETRLAAEPAPSVLIGELRDFSFELKLICHAPNSVWFPTRSDLRRALLIRAKEIALPIPLPAQVVYTAPLEKGDARDD